LKPSRRAASVSRAQFLAVAKIGEPRPSIAATPAGVRRQQAKAARQRGNGAV